MNVQKHWIKLLSRLGGWLAPSATGRGDFNGNLSWNGETPKSNPQSWRQSWFFFSPSWATWGLQMPLISNARIASQRSPNKHSTSANSSSSCCQCDLSMCFLNAPGEPLPVFLSSMSRYVESNVSVWEFSALPLNARESCVRSTVPQRFKTWSWQNPRQSWTQKQQSQWANHMAGPEWSRFFAPKSARHCCKPPAKFMFFTLSCSPYLSVQHTHSLSLSDSPLWKQRHDKLWLIN